MNVKIWGFSVMTAMDFVKKYRENIMRLLAAVALSALVGAFIVAFRSGVLPHSADGDAFDTIYAVEEVTE